MKNKRIWLAVGQPLGALSLVLARRHRTERTEVITLQKHRQAALDMVACPTCLDP